MLGGVGVCTDQDEDPISLVGAGCPDLLTIDDEVVAVPDGAGLEGG